MSQPHFKTLKNGEPTNHQHCLHELISWKDPANRLSLHSTTSHPFFDPALPTCPLDPTSLISNTEQQIPLPNRRELGSQPRPLKLPPFPPKVSFARDRRRISEVSASSRRDLRHRLGNEVSSSVGNSLAPSSMRRIVSDPVPRNLGRQATELPVCTTAPDSCATASSFVADSKDKKPLKLSVLDQGSLSPLDTHARFKERSRLTLPSEKSNSSPVSQADIVGLTPASITAGVRGPPVSFSIQPSTTRL
jgi:hypothetical protein